MTTSTDLTHDADNNAGPLTQESFEKQLGTYGRAYGKGQNSRPAMALLCVEAASKLTKVGKDEADKVYTLFAKGAAATQGLEYQATSSHKVQVSKTKQFLTLGQLPAIDGVRVMELTTDKLAELNKRAESPLRGSAYDNMVKVAREQIKQPTVELTADNIEDILSKQPDDKTEIDKVIDAYKKVYTVDAKLADAGIDHQGTADALEDLAQQIADMGGELPAMTKEDREMAKAKQTLQRHGLTAQPMTAAQPANDELQPPPSTLIKQGSDEHEELMAAE